MTLPNNFINQIREAAIDLIVQLVPEFIYKGFIKLSIDETIFVVGSTNLKKLLDKIKNFSEVIKG